MTGCREPWTKPTAPASALIKCPLIPQFADDSGDAHSAWEALMIDLYTDCAQKHDVLRKLHK